VTDPIQVLREWVTVTERAYGRVRLTQTVTAEQATAALAQVEALVQAARESVDIGDEINRCRICWDTWGNHEDDCALAPFKENP